MIEEREPSGGMVPIRNEALSRRIQPLPVAPAGGYAGTTFSGPMPDNLLLIVWRSRWIVLFSVVLTLAAGFVYIQVVTPIYVSTAKLYLNYAGIRVSQAYELGSMPRTDKYLRTQTGLLSSTTVLASAYERLEPEKLRTFQEVDIPVAFLQNKLRVDVGKNDEIISVSFGSPYPLDAAQIVNEVVEAYFGWRSDHEQRDVHQILKSSEEQKTLKEQERTAKEKELDSFLEASLSLTQGSDQSGVATQRYLELQNACLHARTATEKAAQLREAVQDFMGDPSALQHYLQVVGVVGAGAGARAERDSLQAKLMELRLRKQELTDQWTPKHPAVVAIASQMEDLEAQLAKLDKEFAATMLAVAERQYQEAQDTEAQLLQQYEEQGKLVAAANLKNVKYVRLQTQIDSLAKSSQTLEQDITEIKKVIGEEDVGRLRMERMESARAALEPSEPQKSKIMALALVLGLVLGGGVAVARGCIDQKLQSADEISAALGLPILGVVPQMSRRGQAQTRAQVVFLRSDSVEAEAFRTVRTAIFFRAQEKAARTLLVTSPGPSDGKSTVVSNLGIAMASAGQKTLILDADFRRPTQHRIFAVDHLERSLSGVFAGQVKLSDAIQPTHVRNLSLLTCGYGIANPAEVLNSPQFARLVQKVAAAYDRVLLDAPPVTVVTDAQIIGANCDCTVLVLRANRCTRKIAQRALDALRSVGVHPLGVIVNEVNKGSGHYGYGYYRKAYAREADRRSGTRNHRNEGTAPAPPRVAALTPERGG